MRTEQREDFWDAPAEKLDYHNIPEPHVVTEGPPRPDFVGPDCEELFGHLTNQLRNYAYCLPTKVMEVQETIDTISRTFEFAKKKIEEEKFPKKALRKSGEHAATHYLHVPIIAIDQGVTDKNSLVALILHDVYEDTEASLDEIEELFGFEVRFIVEGLSKVSVRQLAEFKKKSGGDATVNKLQKSFNDDPRIAFYKTFDGAHNSQTRIHMPTNTPQQIEKILAKIDIATHLAQIAADLGATGVRDLIEEGNMPLILSAEFDQIKQLLTKSHTFILPDVYNEVSKWDLAQYHEVLATHIYFDNCYQIYKKLEVKEDFVLEEYIESEIILEECLPKVKIVCHDLEDLFSMFAKLNLDYGPHSKDTENQMKSMIEAGRLDKTITIKTSKGPKEIDVTLVYSTVEVGGQWLLNGQVDKTDQMYEELQAKVDTASRYYASGEGYTDAIDSMFISVTGTNETDVRILKSGMTALDFAYHVDEVVGLTAVGVDIVQLDKEAKSVPLNYVLKDLDQAIVKQNALSVSPTHYDCITTTKAQASVTRALQTLISEDLEQPTYLDEIIKKYDEDYNIDYGVEVERIKKEALKRGRQIILRKFEKITGESLKFHLGYALFDWRDVERDPLLVSLGLVPQPLLNPNYVWNDVGDAHSKDKSNLDTIISNLVELTKESNVLKITLDDSPLRMSQLSEIFRKFNADVASLEGGPENNNPGLDSRLIYYFNPLDSHDLEAVEKEIRENVTGVSYLWTGLFKDMKRD